MTGLRRSAGRKPVATRPAIPSVTYNDEIDPKAFKRLRKAVAEINDPAHKRCLIEGFDLPTD
jgi:pyruvate/2-oxoglutarate dehydrogenase complex dihydrolipoamide acyltransferase (E2) component